MLLLIAISISVLGQTKGKVIDSETRLPVSGATVKGNDIATTNNNGEFSVSADTVITVSSTGYKTITLKAANDFMTVSLQKTGTLLNEVVVTAYNSKRPLLTVAAPVAVVSKTDINRGDNTSLIPILNAIPGVKLDYYTYGDYRLNIRGGALAQPSVHSTGYRMYWNDIPISDASGGSPLNGMDLNFINSMEIIKGPGSSMYGSGFGGVVLVNTDRGQQNGSVISTDNMYGGYKTFRSSTGVRSDFSKGNIAFQYTRTESGGYRDNSNTNANVYNLYGQLYAGTKGTWSYLVNYENSTDNIPGELDSATFKQNPRTATTIAPTGFGPNKITVGTGYRHRFNDKWSAGIGAYYQNDKAKFVLSYPYFGIFEKEPSNGLNTRATATYQDTLGKTAFKLSTGVEWGYNNGKGISYNGDFNTDTAVITGINTAETQQLLGFVQAEFILPGDFFVTGGLSYNHYDYDVKSGTNTPTPIVYTTHEQKLVPRISLLKKVGRISAYVAAGGGFSTPAAGILNDFLNTDGSINNDLKSSTGWNYEIGSRGSTRNEVFFYDIAFYYLKIKDAIIARLFQVQPGVNVERKTNAGEIKQMGIEALAGVNFAADENNFFHGSQLRAGYTFNDYTYEDYKTFKTEYDASYNTVYVPADYSGKEIPGTFKNSWLVMLDIKTKAGLYLNYTLNSYSGTYISDENSSKTDPYTLMNLRIGYNKTVAKGKFGLHPYIGINNLGNTLYSSLTVYNSTTGAFFNPGYRRQFFAGLKLSLYL